MLRYDGLPVECPRCGSPDRDELTGPDGCRNLWHLYGDDRPLPGTEPRRVPLASIRRGVSKARWAEIANRLSATRAPASPPYRLPRRKDR